MKSNKPRVITACTLLLVLSAIVLWAETKDEYRFNNGLCPEGSAVNRWYSTTYYRDGKPYSIEGQTCDGTYYNTPIHTIIVPTDPTNGATPVHTGTTAIGTWWAVITWGEFGEPEPIGGQLPTGEYWAPVP